MNVLIVGRGGREHAICKAMAKAPSVERIFCAPGNAGISSCAERVKIDENDQDSLVKFAKENKVDLTVVGPEQPLAEGIVDRFLAEGLSIFGPTKEASQIEGSKSFAKDLMQKYHVPTAAYETFQDAAMAKSYLQKHGVPIVIKADGLAAGKGVVVAMTMEEAEKAIDDMLIEERFGASSNQIVVEEFLEGEEFSFMALVHEDVIIPLELAQDHKRAFDGDSGPNTGGMGAYSPVDHLPEGIEETSFDTILKPVVHAMIKEGRPFTGVLYAGLILTEAGPKVIEFNARFGDPETQVVLPRLKTDLAAVLSKLIKHEKTELEWEKQSMVGVVLAAEGYPGEYKKQISLNQFKEEQEWLFHAGTEWSDENLYSTGGRVLLAARFGDSILQAQEKVYSFLENHNTQKLFYRRDIGHQAAKKR
ncbi:phosphoribosylamine--glycine ligase [Jeotgalibacillus campisalis]|uniref:Phosphoribosylamine--glycine ligase n=1 Tax=Jeotgalibacillus campisalis TaxID=220754 RepID=A0A0C2RYZ9_9BACL|nr:phosphoribosylamine--glycine ligase [Jeotgalibacillus campisalis]KIL47004.1 phosphoribosylamine--glycine ligase [Jeotgalibacillus campisalis]